MDFVLANGPSRLVKVRTAISMYGVEDFKQADFYLDLKHTVTRCFGGQGVVALDACLAELDDLRKQPAYTSILAGLRQWIGRKQFEAPFAVPEKDWVAGDLLVRVRPDLGLVYKGESLVIKLYFKEEPLNQHRVNPLLHLLATTHGELGTVAILDTRRGKLFKITRVVKDIDAFLAAEAQAFVSLWDSLAG